MSKSSSTLSQAVAQVLRSELAARQVDWTEYAAKTGQAKTTVWRKVRGTSKMSLDDVEVFARALGWTMDELVGRAEALRDSGEVFTVSDDDDATASELLEGMSPRNRQAAEDARRGNGGSGQGSGRTDDSLGHSAAI